MLTNTSVGDAICHVCIYNMSINSNEIIEERCGRWKIGGGKKIVSPSIISVIFQMNTL